MQNNQDFGFNSNEFLGELSSIPYAQFFNASDEKFGIAITSSNAELANSDALDVQTI